jgi:hypothetical protein
MASSYTGTGTYLLTVTVSNEEEQLIKSCLHQNYSFILNQKQS